MYLVVGYDPTRNLILPLAVTIHAVDAGLVLADPKNDRLKPEVQEVTDDVIDLTNLKYGPQPDAETAALLAGVV